MEVKTYNKLIRDRIPEVMAGRNVGFTTYVAELDEYRSKLRDKLREEVEEFIEDSNEEELADILEVIDAIIDAGNLSRQRIEDLKREKAERKGSFRGRIVLVETFE